MAVTDRQILTIIDPDIADKNRGSGKILLETLSIEDTEDEKGLDTPNPKAKDSSEKGSQIPYIKINTNRISNSDLISFSLDVSDFLPRLKVVFSDSDDKFKNMDFPKDGDVISVYIRPMDLGQQKKIRCDFDILSTNVSPGSESEPAIFNFNGILRVPGLFSESIEGFSKDTCFNHLSKVCEDVGVGFASNVESTEDSMTRLRASETRSKFIKDSTGSSWKDENSFFTSFIDPWYYLCFVNVNSQFSEEFELEQGPTNMTSPGNFRPGDQPDKPLGEGDIFFTNSPESKGNDNYITRLALKNDSASVWMSEGYKRYAQHFELDSFEFISEFVDPLVTLGSEKDFILPKGKPNDNFYETQNKFKYLGKQETDSDSNDGNVHLNYSYAKIHNYQNMREISKMKISIELESTNFNIYRYQRVPLDIYSGNSIQSQLIAKKDEFIGEEGVGTEQVAEPQSMYRNDFLSGFYVIDSYSYSYKQGDRLRQKLTMVRREWPIPAESLDD